MGKKERGKTAQVIGAVAGVAVSTAGASAGMPVTGSLAGAATKCLVTGGSDAIIKAVSRKK